MNVESIRSYCLEKPGRIREGFPFGEGVLVFKVEGKMFLLLLLDRHPATMNVKCDPARAIELREQYEAVTPGYHMNKRCWNTVALDNSIPSHQLFAMVDHSYDEVVKGLKTSVRERLLGAKPGAGRAQRRPVRRGSRPSR